MGRTEVLPSASRRPGAAETGAALSLAARMPRLVLESRRVAASLSHGLHGRRRAGSGESFWQFRPYVSGEGAGRIDWRRSGRDDRLYVREREWETPHAIWLWVDRSASMAFQSHLGRAPKVERAVVLALALADAFVNAGERVGLLGLRQPSATRRIAEVAAETLAGAEAQVDDDLPPATAVGRTDEILLISDFLSPLPEIVSRVEALSSRGARGHIVTVVDPGRGDVSVRRPGRPAGPRIGIAAAHRRRGRVGRRVSTAPARATVTGSRTWPAAAAGPRRSTTPIARPPRRPCARSCLSQGGRSGPASDAA